jgi:hypothetical protein
MSLSVAGYLAESGSGGALFAETPNGLGADGLSLNVVRSKVRFSSLKFITPSNHGGKLSVIRKSEIPLTNNQ